MFNPTDFLEPDAERAAGDVIDGEAIIINLVTGAYYSMQGIGGEIWSRITARRTPAAILEEILATYDVAPEEAERDLDALLRQMFDEGIIRVATAGDPLPPFETAAIRKPYRRPALQVFRDMEELLALDPPAPGMNQISWSGGRGSDSR